MYMCIKTIQNYRTMAKEVGAKWHVCNPRTQEFETQGSLTEGLNDIVKTFLCKQKESKMGSLLKVKYTHI